MQIDKAFENVAELLDVPVDIVKEVYSKVYENVIALRSKVMPRANSTATVQFADVDRDEIVDPGVRAVRMNISNRAPVTFYRSDDKISVKNGDLFEMMYNTRIFMKINSRNGPGSWYPSRGVTIRTPIKR